MIQEYKELLLKDLCARLPYGVKCNALLKQIDGSLKSVFGTFKGYNNGLATVGNNLVDIETVRPYLRPMSSMTEEEFFEYRRIKYSKVTYREEYKRIDVGKYHNVGIIPIDEYLDWLNAHHFDYRGLIERGLAIKVTPDNNPYE
jgi:hypothetical protein